MTIVLIGALSGAWIYRRELRTPESAGYKYRQAAWQEAHNFQRELEDS